MEFDLGGRIIQMEGRKEGRVKDTKDVCKCHGECFFWKTPHATDTELRGLNLGLIWKPPPGGVVSWYLKLCKLPWGGKQSMFLPSPVKSMNQIDKSRKIFPVVQ